MKHKMREMKTVIVKTKTNAEEKNTVKKISKKNERRDEGDEDGDGKNKNKYKRKEYHS